MLERANEAFIFWTGAIDGGATVTTIIRAVEVAWYKIELCFIPLFSLYFLKSERPPSACTGTRTLLVKMNK